MLRIVNVAATVMCVTFAAGCGLYEDIPAQGAQGPSIEEPGYVDGDSCGPCKLGTWKKEECGLGLLEGTVLNDATCESIVFVDREASGSGRGTKENPFPTLQEAIDAGNKQNASVIIVAGLGVYEGQITIGDGLSVVGGFDRQWGQDAGLRPTIRAGSTEGMSDNWAVLVDGIKRPTILRNLNIEAVGKAITQYGMRVIDSESLTLERIQIAATDGQPGRNGSPGVDGKEGGNGKSAGINEARAAGLAGVNETCSDANGGRGGVGGLRTSDGAQNATRGDISAMGIQGGDFGLAGQNGADGEDGEHGEPGQAGFLDSGLWILGAPGEAGLDGGHGSGGGGGGGGTVPAGEGSGGGGGGGGAGGCGGQGGGGAKNGGASFGLFTVNSQISIVEATIVSGGGGDGGSGGLGGQGAKGGKPGFGADGTGAGLAGGNGGNGGRGGNGGAGGDGQGGVSYAIFCADNVNVVINDTELRAGNGGLMGGDSMVRAPSGASIDCGL